MGNKQFLLFLTELNPRGTLTFSRFIQLHFSRCLQTKLAEAPGGALSLERSGSIRTVQAMSATMGFLDLGKLFLQLIG